jgi:hypothetical protein
MSLFEDWQARGSLRMGRTSATQQSVIKAEAGRNNRRLL